jgi:hypothetical protein
MTSVAEVRAIAKRLRAVPRREYLSNHEPFYEHETRLLDHTQLFSATADLLLWLSSGAHFVFLRMITQSYIFNNRLRASLSDSRNWLVLRI